ncbi:hypothetical protein ABFS82_02G107200 [Erythranthe guttata]|uniref:uncharacterized protein LOC105969740 n=1 Tax=Erythranthe guttata TaxID=4155 RepID=UPI00064DD4FD|nr:PREDICTED: uncharacterized protein LOC105969740 [Erythranthe guttata]|eukprot:XP_012849966.1 PREDICTED: uncharacterized protein LOC105969740 [Erythranthe guttata]
MEYYMDEKWKIPKDENSINRYSNSSTKISRSASQRSSTKNPFNLSRSCSTSSKSSSLSRSCSQKRPSEFTRKCKEQKSKFYIVKRCITMLVGWKKNPDS